MKKGENFIYSLFAIGILLKLFKLPMHTVFLLVTLLSLIIYYAFSVVRKNKDRYSIIAGLVTVLWLFCLLAILKHFSFQEITFVIAVLLSIALALYLYKTKKLISGNSVFCAVIVVVTVFIKLLPAHQTYYVTNIKFNYEIENDYSSWDRYSWFLYAAGNKEDALLANTSARQALENGLSNSMHSHGNEREYMTILQEHRSAIEQGNWKKNH